VPSNDRITMAEIAEPSGVYLSTVSLVLHERPGVVCPSLLERDSVRALQTGA
jgi:DNA-binding LacI/PurR family transcriptional regulator